MNWVFSFVYFIMPIVPDSRENIVFCSFWMQNKTGKTKPSPAKQLIISKMANRDVPGTRWVVSQRWDVKCQPVLLSRMVLEGQVHCHWKCLQGEI